MAIVRFAPSAERDLNKVPPRYAAAIVEFATSALPENPRRVGKPLRNELAGLYGARRGDYRLIYDTSDDDAFVTIVRVDHRRSAYRPR